MNRTKIVARVNQMFGDGLYLFEEIQYDLDGAISEINFLLDSLFPPMSAVLITEDSRYVYTDSNGAIVPYFPTQFIDSVVVNFVVKNLLRRVDDFSATYSVADDGFSRGLDTMWVQLFGAVPDEFINKVKSSLPLEGSGIHVRGFNPKWR